MSQLKATLTGNSIFGNIKILNLLFQLLSVHMDSTFSMEIAMERRTQQAKVKPRIHAERWEETSFLSIPKG